MRLSGRLLLAPVLLLPGCGGDEPNPFASQGSIAKLRPTSALVFATDAWADKPGPNLEIFALDENGEGLLRLTRCNGETACNNLEVSPAWDRKRLAIRRVDKDTNSDGLLTSADGETLIIGDVARGIEGEVTLRVQSTVGSTVTNHLNGLDWSPLEDIIVYGAAVANAPDDLFRSVPRPDTSGGETFALTTSSQLDERAPRVDPTGSVAVFESVDAPDGRGSIAIFVSTTQQPRITSGGAPGPALPGTPYVIGSDATPDYSADGNRVVFRRLTGPGPDGRGSWSLYTVATDGGGLVPIVTGDVWRSAPDWGPKGILFAEADTATGGTALVVVDANGGGRRVVARFAAGFKVESPRWLP
ncbi:MAG: hypothetical protein AB7O37_17735 [Vicinamibacteria bacterium]